MKSKTSTSQKIGLAIFTIGALYMFCLGWLYSWRMVTAANVVMLGTEVEGRRASQVLS